MSSPDPGATTTAVAAATAPPDRRAAVLESALLTFARFGYRRTSMEEVARAAHISRPGLYFLFSAKEALFRAAVTQALERDLATVEGVLAERERPLRERLLEAFDTWAGRYVGPLTRDVTTVIEDNPDLLGAVVQTAPGRFEDLVTAAVEHGTAPGAPADVTRDPDQHLDRHQAPGRVARRLPRAARGRRRPAAALIPGRPRARVPARRQRPASGRT